MGHYPPYQTHIMPCTASLLSYLWESYVFRRVPYHSHVWEWYGLWEWYGMIAMQWNDMGIVWEVQSVPYLTHIYGKDTYFVKIHTIPIHGNDIGYGNGMGWLPCEGMVCELTSVPYQTHIYGKDTSAIRMGVTAPYLSQNYSRKQPLCDCLKVLLFNSWTRC